MAITYENSCKGKAQCVDRRAARTLRQRLRGLHGAAGTLHIYACQFCPYFHVGHIPASVSRGDYDKDSWRDNG